MYLAHKGEIQQNVTSIAQERMQQNTMCLVHKGEIQQNVASIAQVRYERKHNVFSAQQ